MDFSFLPKQLLTTKTIWHKQMLSPVQAMTTRNVSGDVRHSEVIISQGGLSMLNGISKETGRSVDTPLGTNTDLLTSHSK